MSQRGHHHCAAENPIVQGRFSAMTNDNTGEYSDSSDDRSVARPLSLRLHPDPVLRDVCSHVERFDSWLSDVFSEMLALMRAHNGIGLAGPQVGLTQRLFAAEIQGRSVCLVNPVITTGHGSDHMVEGCLSLPYVQIDVQRDWQIEVQGFDAQGRKREYCVEGLWARVMQHEIDHLDGVLIYDYKKLHRHV